MEENKSKNQKSPVEVRILRDGPMMIKGNFSFKDISGKVVAGDHELYLCRCGGSSSKPYCDGTHKKIGIVN